MFESSIQLREQVTTRLQQMTSFYINKYEKIHHLDNYGLLVDRFELLLQAFEMEAYFQFFKLRLLLRLNYLAS